MHMHIWVTLSDQHYWVHMYSMYHSLSYIQRVVFNMWDAVISISAIPVHVSGPNVFSVKCWPIMSLHQVVKDLSEF